MAFAGRPLLAGEYTPGDRRSFAHRRATDDRPGDWECHRDQRRDLQSFDCSRKARPPNVEWRGTSDTETLLLGYARWGHAVLEHLKGMFAFAIYDAARNEIFLARDRLGIKPLYYTATANGFGAASEVRVLAPRSAAIKPEAVSAYLQWGACPEGELIYSGIQALPAGHAMTVGPDGEIKTWRYWPARKTFALFPDNVIGRLRALIDNAVEEHLLSDVPVASFLSGGIDSSVVTALAAQKLAHKLQTYSVGFDLAEFDETAIAGEIASRYGTDHHRIQLSEERSDRVRHRSRRQTGPSLG